MLVRAVPMHGAPSLQEPKGHVIRWFGSSTDISDIVEARRVSARSQAELYICFSVTDTGIGMDAATLARVCEPFFTTKQPGQGTGLGLAMAHGFAAQSGGGLHIESAPGHGTTVLLWLPLAEAAVVRLMRKPITPAHLAQRASEMIHLAAKAS